MKKENSKRNYIGKVILAFALGLVLITFIRYMSYGGMGTGTQVNTEEFMKAAEKVDDIKIPENVKIVARQIDIPAKKLHNIVGDFVHLQSGSLKGSIEWFLRWI